MQLKTSYRLISKEYYNDDHLTCRLFDELNKKAIINWELSSICHFDYNGILEVGCGRSNIADLDVFKNKRVYLSDISMDMLINSKNQLKGEDRYLLVSSSTKMPFANKSIKLVFSFLSDAYNFPEFYLEAHRVLKAEGMLYGTIPSFEWAELIRKEYVDKNIARFNTDDGTIVDLPSYIDNRENLGKKIYDAGFRKVKINAVNIPKNINRIPKNLLTAAEKYDFNIYQIPILYSYFANK
jgi:ubiquinone/menaquinone biosynthesis C-methylase UbiE